jgi:hypothetical protein
MGEGLDASEPSRYRSGSLTFSNPLLSNLSLLLGEHSSLTASPLCLFGRQFAASLMIEGNSCDGFDAFSHVACFSK